VLPSARVEADLRRRIASGEWASGQQLPRVRELAGHYHVSNRTISKVLRVLDAEDLVLVVRSWGVFKT
jgi:DNA-binding GntR family transcriptional regulator